jgi:predicted dehydrogenase
MPADTAIRVGLVGYGLAGAVFHAPLIVSTPGLHLTVIVTSNPERQQQARSTYPAAQILDTADRLWDNPSLVDLVVVASPNRHHAPQARAALRSGLAVVVEKPFAVTTGEGRQVLEEARARELLITAFHNRRWDGDFLTVRRLIGEGELGRVLRFESRFERWRPIPKVGWRERGTPEDAGGLLYDLGSHLVDQALVLFGPVTHVYAEMDRRRPGVEVDDDTFVALSHASGVRSHLWMTTVAAQAGPRFRVLGSRAAFTKYGLDVQEDALRRGQRPDEPGWGEEPPDLWGRAGAGNELRTVPTEPGAYPEFYRRLLAALRDGAPPPVEPEDALSGLEILEAARRSASEARTVSTEWQKPAPAPHP